MRLILFVLISILISSCAKTIPTDYSGSDAGYAVIGLGTSTNYTYKSYSFNFRRIGEEPNGRFRYPRARCYLCFSSNKDYKSSNETGIVEIAVLQPGHYEVGNFVSSSTPVHGSKQDFSIPFEIKPGQVIYLGNYQANRMLKNRDVFFVVDDRFEMDLAIAKKREELLPVDNAVNATPDVRKINNAFLVPAEKPAREAVKPRIAVDDRDYLGFVIDVIGSTAVIMLLFL